MSSQDRTKQRIPGNWYCGNCRALNLPSKRQCCKCAVVRESKTKTPNGEKPDRGAQSLHNLSVHGESTKDQPEALHAFGRGRGRVQERGQSHARGRGQSHARGRGQSHARGRGQSHARGRGFARGQERRSNSLHDLRLNSTYGETKGSKCSDQRESPQYPFGYKELQRMLSLHPEEIVVHLQGDTSRFNLLLDCPEDINAEKMCMLMQVLARAAKTCINREGLNTIFAKTFKHKFVSHLIRFALTALLNTDGRINLGEYFQNLWEVLDKYTHAMPSMAMNELFELIQACLMCLKTQSVTQTSELIEKYETTKSYLEDEKNKWKMHMGNEPNKWSKGVVNQFQYQDDLPPPDDFRLISVVPTIAELNDLERPFLRRNLIQGKYEDVEHYLDIHFRLLREDFVRPLRNGIQDLITSVNSKNRDIFIYRDVKILNEDIKFFSLIHNIQLTLPKHFKVENSKRFMFGNLVCLSCDNFKTVYFGSVSEKTDDMLKKGIIGIKFDTDVDPVRNKSFIMVESRSFFTAYKHVLSALQKINEDNFPMKDFIVHIVNNIPLPDYLHSGTDYDLQVLLSKSMLKASEAHNSLFRQQSLPQKQCVVWPALQKVSITRELDFWPASNDLHIDESQRRALKGALTSKLSIIQGPPGTGKTFMGLKIAQVLLHNSSVWKSKERDSPILVVCYTNHALDQFLEGLTQFTDSIVRVGSRTKSEIIQGFQINNLVKNLRTRRAMPIMIKNVNSEIMMSLNKLEKKVASLRQTLLQLKQPIGILTENVILNANVMPRNIADLFKKKRVCLQTFLLDVDCFNLIEHQIPTSSNINADDSCNDVPETEDNFENADDLYNEEESERKLDSDDTVCHMNVREAHSGVLLYDIWEGTLEREIMILQESKDHLSVTEILECERKLTFMTQKLQLLRYGLSTLFNPEEAALLETQDILSLAFEQRWTLYKLWLHRIAEGITITLTESLKEYEKNACIYKEIKDQEYLYVMRHASVVGMTTTGAAQHTNVLQALQPMIVIVEEAAEILEAHVITSLTNECQHLILIGDHQQLQPSATVYELATKYGLETSLFERLIHNNVTYQTLEYQHRMRAEISRLLVPTIYPSLKDHDSVHQYPHIRGMVKDVFFVTHNHHEEKERDDNNSKANSYEAEFIMAICRHLMLQGYSTEDVTVLTPYSGQFFLLKKIQRNYEECQGVRVSIVDNFQGEESKIILLSLVRSNDEGIVGFLKKENRVCVALSRAKHGMYIVGNMDQLQRRSDLWRKICTDLAKQKVIGDSIVLQCENHPEMLSTVTTGEDILMASPEGGCTKLCSSTLPKCGHSCPNSCHVIDSEHKYIKCPLPCPKILCERDHKCPFQCWEDCSPCKVRIPKLLSCGHTMKIPCHTFEESHKCHKPVEKVITSCQHRTTMMCCEDPNTYPCPVSCEIRLPCGHKCTRTCHVTDDPDHLKYMCNQPCPLLLEGCSMQHKCLKKCFEECGPCNINIKKKAECGHTHFVQCSKPMEEIECINKCKRLLPCGHHCPRKCKDPCGGCTVQVKKTVAECQHEIKVECGKPPQKSMCYVACILNLPCGHNCQDLCKDPCTNECKILMDTDNQCPKGHKIKLPCSLRDKVTGEDAWAFCSQPCGILLDCKHYCKGECGACLHGRLHIACGEKCEKSLVCGHICKAACSSACPPCQANCPMRCEHSRCGKKCGEPCSLCQEKCQRSCAHKECNRPCRMKCAQKLCEKPCKKHLKCGHQCVGLCGDPCPPLCRTCDAEELTQIIFGNEDDPNARFVLLEDCGHVVEAEGLRQWLAVDSGEIAMKQCPRCKIPIYNNRRNLEVVMEVYDNTRHIKNKYYSNDSKEQLEEIRNLMEGMKGLSYFKTEMQQVCASFPAIFSQNPRQTYYSPISDNEINLCKFELQVVHQMNSLLSENPSRKKSLTPHINFIKKRLMEQNLRISPQMMEEISCELQRLHILPTLWKLRESTEVQRLTELIKIKCNLETLMDPTIRFDKALEKRVKLQLKESEQYLGGLNVSEKERIEILQAMGLAQGHWYKCPNGHIYCIANCGRAMEEGKCPECGAAIGGGSHRLRADNTTASEMFTDISVNI